MYRKHMLIEICLALGQIYTTEIETPAFCVQCTCIMCIGVYCIFILDNYKS